MLKERLPMSGIWLAVAFTLCVPAISSHAVITFEKTYGGEYGDVARCVRQTSDGGYVIAGWTSSYGAGKLDWYLVRTDSLGDVLWERVFGLGREDWCWSVVEAQGGGFVASGEMLRDQGKWGYGLLKLDSSGDSVWARNHGILDFRGYVRETSDGGYIIVGASTGVWSGRDLCLVKTDSTGELVWSSRYGGSEADFGHDVYETADGGFIATGATWSFSEVPDIYLVRTTVSGDLVWEKVYGGTKTDGGSSVIQTSDEGFLVAGYTKSFGAGADDVYLIHTDSNGDSTWARTYGGPQADWAVSHQKTVDGGCIIVGATSSFGAGGGDVYLIKTDPFGDIAWTRTYGGPDADVGYFVRQTMDGGYIIAGATNSFGAGDSDVYLIKTDKYGRVHSCDPVEPWEPRTQGYWRRQCKNNPHEDICAYVDSIQTLAALFDAFGCDSICDLMNVNPPENDMCRKARRQFMALLLNIASGKLAVCNCLEDGREIGYVIAEIDSLLSNDPAFHTCVYAKTLADDINNGISIVPCDTVWTRVPSKTVEPPSISVAPNPFAKSTIIEYKLKAPGPVQLEVYNCVGRQVTAVTKNVKSKGLHRIVWDGLDSHGHSVPSGIYFVHLETEGYVTTRRLVRIR